MNQTTQLTPLQQFILKEWSGKFEAIEFTPQSPLKWGQGGALNITVYREELKADTSIYTDTIQPSQIRALGEELERALNEAERRLE